MVFCVIHRAIIDDHLHHDDAVVSCAGTVVAPVGAKYKTAVVSNSARRRQFVIDGGKLHGPSADG